MAFLGTPALSSNQKRASSSKPRARRRRRHQVSNSDHTFGGGLAQSTCALPSLSLSASTCGARGSPLALVKRWPHSRTVPALPRAVHTGAGWRRRAGIITRRALAETNHVQAFGRLENERTPKSARKASVTRYRETMRMEPASKESAARESALTRHRHLSSRDTTLSQRQRTVLERVKSRSRILPVDGDASNCKDRAIVVHSAELQDVCFGLRSVQVRYSLPADRLPTRKQLLSSGRGDLVYRIRKLGGMQRIADALQWEAAQPRRDWSVLRHVLDEYIDFLAIFDGPAWTVTCKDLRDHGYGYLLQAMRLHGGFSRIRALGQEHHLKQLRTQKGPGVSVGAPGRFRAPPGYWNAFENVEHALREFCQMYGIENRVPRKNELLAAGRGDLVNAIRKHGGFHQARERLALGAGVSRRARGYWDDFCTVQGEVGSFIHLFGYPGLMPSAPELRRHQRGDLVYAIERHGGFSRVARLMHLFWHGPYSFWRDLMNLERRIDAYVEMKGMGRYFPSFAALHAEGRFDLIFGIQLHGGFLLTARKMKRLINVQQRSAGFWRDPRNVQSELREFCALLPMDMRGTMPSSVFMVKAGRADLAYGVRDCGGWIFYAQRLGLRFSFPRRPSNFWANPANVKRELRVYIKDRGLDTRRMPSLDNLKLDGRSDIAFAIQRYHGGQDAYAEYIGMPVTLDRGRQQVSIEWLHSWQNFSLALSSWIDRNGFPDLMPARDDLLRTQRHDLRYAVHVHGGYEQTARRMGLIFVTPGNPESWLVQWLGLQASKLMVDVRELHERRVRDPAFMSHLAASASMRPSTRRRDSSGSSARRLAPPTVRLQLNTSPEREHAYSASTQSSTQPPHPITTRDMMNAGLARYLYPVNPRK
ncbi:hypothetical protein FVE85_6291 [Porphyridium purpureum]|uniref:Uncharacterized protein n=1 Tax=Porphyridium purpureum TaxID=35688 RepID=A0A5J4Z4V2_PORPP|nr:hypothetical protein FVE85_6291 [Porphyridium purpureum]|eukprot:POR6617..scf295_1